MGLPAGLLSVTTQQQKAGSRGLVPYVHLQSDSVQRWSHNAAIHPQAQ